MNARKNCVRICWSRLYTTVLNIPDRKALGVVISEYFNRAYGEAFIQQFKVKYERQEGIKIKSLLKI